MRLCPRWPPRPRAGASCRRGRRLRPCRRTPRAGSRTTPADRARSGALARRSSAQRRSSSSPAAGSATYRTALGRVDCAVPADAHARRWTAIAARAAPVERERDECGCEQPEHGRPPCRRCHHLYAARAAQGPSDLRRAGQTYRRHGPTRAPRSRRRSARCSRSRRPPSPGRRGGTALALVTADLEACDRRGRPLQRRDPRSAEDARRPPQHREHRRAGPRSSRTPKAAGSPLVDSRLRVRPIVGDFGAPRYTAVSPGRRLAYVTDSERQEVAVVESGRPPRHRPDAPSAVQPATSGSTERAAGSGSRSGARRTRSRC